MNILFQKGNTADIEILLDMMASFNAIDGYLFNRDLTRQNLLEFLTNESLGRLWMIFSDDLIAGYVVLTFGFSFEYGGRDAFIDELYLKEEFRSKGIGSITMDFVVDEATKLGVRVIHLEVEKHNEKGSRLYIKKGFAGGNRMLLTRKISTR